VLTLFKNDQKAEGEIIVHTGQTFRHYPGNKLDNEGGGWIWGTNRRYLPQSGLDLVD
jgi:hypothetical protein